LVVVVVVAVVVWLFTLLTEPWIYLTSSAAPMVLKSRLPVFCSSNTSKHLEEEGAGGRRMREEGGGGKGGTEVVGVGIVVAGGGVSGNGMREW